MPRSSRRLLDPQDHRSLEDITLHAQLGVLAPEPVELGPLVVAEPVLVASLDPVLVHPVAQRPGVDPEISGHLGDRLARLANNPDRSLTELRVEPSSCLWH